MSDSMHVSSAAASLQAMSASASTVSSQQTSPEKEFPLSASRNINNASISRRLSFGSSRRNSDESSGSPAVSLELESEYSVSSEGSKAFSSQRNTKDSESDNEDISGEGITAWRPVDVSGMIRLNLKSREKDQMEYAVKEIDHVLARIKHRCGIKSNVKLTREMCLRFVIANYLRFVASNVEKMRIMHDIRESPMEFDEVRGFFKIVMMSMFYRVMPGVLFERDLSANGLMPIVNQQRQRFFMIWKLLQLRRASVRRASHIVDSFNSQLEECVSNSVSVFTSLARAHCQDTLEDPLGNAFELKHHLTRPDL